MQRLAQCYRVCDLMRGRGVDVAWLTRETGLDDRVAKAIYHQRYTPSPVQRMRVARALGAARDEIIWGHAIETEPLKEPI